jgi:ABC-type phosphate transport system substrate-binding protein
MRTRTKATLLSAVSLIAAAGLTGAIALPANADPTNPNPTNENQEVALVGVGSDTIQDLFSGLTQSVTDGSGNQVFASYDATGSAQIKTRVLGQQFDRPNGSGPGLIALRSAVQGLANQPDNGTNVALHGSDVQFSRSSSFTAIAAGGRYSEIPIAVDAMSYATNGGAGGTHIPSGIVAGGTPTAAPGTTGSPDPLTLSNIFAGNGYISGVVSGTTYQFYSGTGASSDQTNWPKLDVYVPQSGSGTYKFWVQALGLPAIQNGVLNQFNGVPNEEHDGTAIDGDPYGILPFSIAQWIAQSTATVASTGLNAVYHTSITDRRHNAVLNSVGTVAPTVSGKLNTAFPLARPVFVDVEYSQLKINPLLTAVFVNDSNFAANSTIYDAANPKNQRTNVITDFGFAKIPAAGFTPTVAGYGGTTFFAGDATDYRFN